MNLANVEKILYFDCFSGICGDMTLAALVDLGVPEDHLRAELAKLGLQGWRLRLKPGSKTRDMAARRADVDLLPTPVKRRLFALSGTKAESTPSRVPRHKEDDPGQPPPRGGEESGPGHIRKARRAEAKVHGTEVEDVAFHEVGAVDSIVDIVGAAICLDFLAPDRVLCSSVELGGGFVKCQHGVIPVPAPAVVELLKGVPVKSGAVQNETTTPTGAAILAACVDEFTDDKRFGISRTAYGSVTATPKSRISSGSSRASGRSPSAAEAESRDCRLPSPASSSSAISTT